MRLHTTLLTILLTILLTASAHAAAPVPEVPPTTEVTPATSPEGACADHEPPPLEVRRHPTGDGRALLEVVCAYYAYQEALEIWMEGPAGVTGQ